MRRKGSGEFEPNAVPLLDIVGNCRGEYNLPASSVDVIAPGPGDRGFTASPLSTSELADPFAGLTGPFGDISPSSASLLCCLLLRLRTTTKTIAAITRAPKSPPTTGPATEATLLPPPPLLSLFTPSCDVLLAETTAPLVECSVVLDPAVTVAVPVVGTEPVVPCGTPVEPTSPVVDGTPVVEATPVEGAAVLATPVEACAVVAGTPVVEPVVAKGIRD
jgi:hypothetical protein